MIAWNGFVIVLLYLIQPVTMELVNWPIAMTRIQQDVLQQVVQKIMDVWIMKLQVIVFLHGVVVMNFMVIGFVLKIVMEEHVSN